MHKSTVLSCSVLTRVVNHFHCCSNMSNSSISCKQKKKIKDKNKTPAKFIKEKMEAFAQIHDKKKHRKISSKIILHVLKVFSKC